MRANAALNIYFGNKRVACIELVGITVSQIISALQTSLQVRQEKLKEESDYYPFGTEVIVTGGIYWKSAGKTVNPNDRDSSCARTMPAHGVTFFAEQTKLIL
jgi:hypothetical protein